MARPAGRGGCSIMSGEPLITVAMPVRNCEATVARAVASILDQTKPRFELVIIDDGSSDATRDRVARFGDPRIRLIAGGRSLGLPARLNEIVRMARGTYIARMDGDDFSYPERFASQLAFLDGNVSVDLVGASAIAFRSNGQPIGAFSVETTHAAICRRPELGFGIPHPTWMGRTAWFARHPYPASALRAQDQALLTAVYRTSSFANLPEPLLGYHQDVPTLHSIIGGRWHHGRAIVRHAVATRDWKLLAAGVAHHAVRAAVTVPPVLMGQGEAVLARRFRPLAAAERAQFLAIKAGLESGGV